MKIIQSVIRAFTVPTAHEKARIELQRAQSSLLEAHSAKEYAEAMVLYHDTRIARLSAYLSSRQLWNLPRPDTVGIPLPLNQQPTQKETKP